ncbi:hypothetical protein BLNAU_9389 [Blattamonas nauphoetae]|uniref:Uncharacterized protein n=1 Tax=Blattamonas nauphoetae TaxID=2049346 RepID=A0ABQ9XW44_9EUKA|nr:hypothetical protein BLNAU_9389 [Blattamonas nauphoetae]
MTPHNSSVAGEVPFVTCACLCQPSPSSDSETSDGMNGLAEHSSWRRPSLLYPRTSNRQVHPLLASSEPLPRHSSLSHPLCEDSPCPSTPFRLSARWSVFVVQLDTSFFCSNSIVSSSVGSC